VHAKSQPAAPKPAARDRGQAALWLILAVTLARLLFLFVSPYELSADEAQYWDWSRRLELSYHTKGPGAAWTIAASTHLLGVSEFAVRAPAALVAAVMMLALAALARRIAGAPVAGRAAFMSVLVALCIPAYHAAALLMTIDGPMLACWAVAALAAWNIAVDAPPPGGTADAPTSKTRKHLAWGAALGISLGVGFLFKYTILLAGAGLLLFIFLTRARRTRSALPPLVIAAILFAACIGPVILWNAQRRWPTVAHLLGHLGLAGSDLPAAAASSRAYSPLWTLEYLGVLIALAGPIVLAMILAVRAGLKAPSAAPASAEQRHLRAGALLGLCGAAPVLLAYLVASFFTDIEGNWPIGAWVTLIPVTGAFAVTAMDDHRARIARWNAQTTDKRRRAGFLRRKPETPFQLSLHWGLSVGVVGAIGMMLIGPVSRAPLVGPLIPFSRIDGARYLAAAVDRQREALAAQTDAVPFVVGSRYTHSALLAFYCDGRPSVYCAGSRLGDRRSAYDDFPDTDLADPGLLSRPAVLVDAGRHASPDRWLRALRFDHPPSEATRVGPNSSPRVIYTARGYAGPVVNAPPANPANPAATTPERPSP